MREFNLAALINGGMHEHMCNQLPYIKVPGFPAPQCSVNLQRIALLNKEYLRNPNQDIYYK